MILGAGVGWNDAEYEAVGVHKSERGKRTDEMLDIMVPLLEGETRHVPRPLLLGRRRVHRADGVAAARRSGSAAGRSSRIPSRRTCRASWSRSRHARSAPTAGSRGPPARRRTSPATGPSCRRTIREHGRDPGECVVAHENFLHLVLTDDPAKAREEQHRAFLKVMSAERGPEYLESVYLFGTPDEVIASLQARVDAGVEYFMLHTMTPDPAQLRHWVDEIIPNVTFPADGRSGPADRQPAPPVTRRVALIGKPLRRRHSQVMHDAAFDAAGIDARYVLLELEPEAVEAAVPRRAGPTGSGSGSPRRTSGWSPGCATRWRRTPRRSARSTTSSRTRRRQAGRASTPTRPGFRAGVELAMGRPLAGADVVVAGAGGAAHAVVFACLRAGAAPGDDREPDRRVRRRARASGSPTSGRGPSRPWRWTTRRSRRRFDGADLAVNATTVGMLDPGVDHRRSTCCRRARRSSTWSTCRPRRRCCAAARARGLRAANGSEMLIAAGGDRLRALDRRRRDGRRHARGGRAAPRRRDRTRLTDAPRDHRRGRRTRRSRWSATGSCLSLPDGAARSGPGDRRRRRRWAAAHPGMGGRASRRRPAGRSTRSSSGRPCRTRARSTRSGCNYVVAGEADDDVPERPLVYGKLPSAVAGPRRVVTWDRVADGQRRSRVRARRRHRRGRPGRSSPRTPWATSSGTRASTTCPRATRGSTATSGCSASRWPASARSAPGS